MLWLDFIFILPLIWGAYSGWKDGVLDDIVVAIHFLIAFALSFKILSVAFYYLNAFIFTFSANGSTGVSSFSVMLFATSVGATFILLGVSNQYLKTHIEYDFEGAWDNISGSIFGVIKYILVSSFIVWFLQGFGEFNKDMRSKSYLFAYIEKASYTIIGVKDARQMSDVILEFSGVKE